jgi:cytosine deaminase
MLLRGATLADGSRADVRLAGESIAELGPAGGLAPSPGEESLDLAGYVLLPGLAEPHAHLDKAFTADRVPNATGDLLGAIAAWHAHRATLEVEEIAERARAAALLALSHGATAVRTHVDVGAGIGLRSVEALVRVREELRELVVVQVAAMTYPVSGRAGSENRALLREAVALGADVVGGAPHIDPEPHESLAVYLATAAEFGRPVDLHIDEHLRSSLDLADMAQMVADGFPAAAAASHCVSLGMRPEEVQAEVSAAVAAAGVSVVTLPQTNLYLQARDRVTATPRGLTALKALLQAGVTVAGGGDNAQDAFNPLGRCDPLQTAQLLVAVGHLECDEAYALVSEGARAVMALPPVRMAPGSPADLLAVAGSSLREVVATATEDRLVIHAGRVVARTRVEREVLAAGSARRRGI